MFEYLKGKIAAVHPQYIVIDVNGIGYKLLVANPYRYQDNEETTVYVEQIVRENEQSLYGFYDLNEKELFNRLTSVSGIGPKSALAILAGNDINGVFVAIENGDVKYLTKFPGVGKKTAQQIILDLQGKVSANNVQTDLFGTNDIANSTNKELSDGLEALISLGYTPKDVKKVKEKLSALDKLSADEYVREGLKLLMG